MFISEGVFAIITQRGERGMSVCRALRFLLPLLTSLSAANTRSVVAVVAVECANSRDSFKKPCCIWPSGVIELQQIVSGSFIHCFCLTLFHLQSDVICFAKNASFHTRLWLNACGIAKFKALPNFPCFPLHSARSVTVRVTSQSFTHFKGN